LRDKKRLLGHAVVYPSKPGYMGLDLFLVCVKVDGVIQTGTHATNGLSLDTAAIFLNRDHAVEALDRNPSSGSEGNLPGEVCDVYEETRMILGPSRTVPDEIKRLLKAGI
jgi:hypothetical protein